MPTTPMPFLAPNTTIVIADIVLGDGTAEREVWGPFADYPAAEAWTKRADRLLPGFTEGRVTLTVTRLADPANL